MKKLDPFKFIDVAGSFTDENLEPICGQQWHDFDSLVGNILDHIPEKWRDEYLEIVTDPKF